MLATVRLRNASLPGSSQKPRKQHTVYKPVVMVYALD
jgi:hypothetical protein